MPHLTDHDLSQMDEAWLENLPDHLTRPLMRQLLDDLRETLDQLNQVPEDDGGVTGGVGDSPTE